MLVLKEQKGDLWVISWMTPSHRAAVLTLAYFQVYMCMYMEIYDIASLFSLESPACVQKARTQEIQTIQENVVGQGAKVVVIT